MIIHAEIKFRNALLLRLLSEQFPPTHHQHRYADFQRAAKALGVKYGTLLRLLSVKGRPYYRPPNLESNYSRPTPSALLIAKALGVDVYELFPYELYDAGLPAVVDGEIPASRLLPLWAAKQLPAPGNQDQEIERSELKEAVEEALNTLTPTRRKVIEERFGVGFGNELTLKETGKMMGKHRGRILQIQQRALRQLRHPARARLLRRFLKHEP
jgi:RNA polymerase sigma factor (sigma-70 family)